MRNSIVTFNGIRGEYTGFSEKTGKYYISFYNGENTALSSLDGAIFEGTVFEKLFEALTAEWNKRHEDFINGLSEETNAAEIQNNWRYAELLPAGKKKLQWELLPLKEYLTKRHAKKVARRIAEQLAHLQEVEKAMPFESIEMSIEWKKSRMWGNNPTADVSVNTPTRRFRYNSGSISGCGYDKGSTAVARALNQSPEFLYAMYAFKETYGADKPNRELFGYGSGYGILPSLEGGVGVSCYPAIFEKLGFKWANVGSDKAFDVYNVTKLPIQKAA